MTMARPIPNEPLLLVEGGERVLVAADLHIGIEHHLWLGGASVPSQTGKMLEGLAARVEEASPDRLLLLGDVKHNLPWTSFQEKSEVPRFLKCLSGAVKVEVVAGNHDVGLSDLAPQEVEIHPATGTVIDGAGYFHGHTWPDPKVFEAEVLVASHLHPAVRLADRIGSGPPERAWLRAPLSSEGLSEEYGREITGPDVTIVPAYNPLCGGYPLDSPSREERGALPRIVRLDEGRVYLLDGTDLGRLQRVRAVQSRMTGRGR
ncbi:metallophosphoesterase [Candidatus Methanocrinis natronophilus]|uniref:Metallophosphoesterase n=1 Tax=Candidatus Methanocrinis natronophilus TaxID=3033396 RepID=A0ABT5X5T6_9EURY|nr:metallophosphoesterase [Candidatus Methanocrinis natronophilus]MDF0590063.1 metallophosphoesterase [Candidatus Methanocrinis natronophilus]